MRGPKSYLSHGMSVLGTWPRETLMVGNAVEKFGGSGRSWFGPFGMKRVRLWRSKLAWCPKRSSIGDHNSYRSPRLMVSLRLTFQSSCAYHAHADFCEE